jgi:hypothetical protein
MPSRLTRPRLNALQQVADGKIYRTRPEEFHQAARGYEPRVLWRAKGSPKPVSGNMFQALIDDGLISLDDSHVAILMPSGVRILEDQSDQARERE